jgi:FHS family L-fucose permease-like MFS transporter
LALPFRNISAPGYSDSSPMKTDARAMTVTTALFFMVGFLTCLNDIVEPHLKSIFDLSYRQSQFIPFYFFASYFVFSYPSGLIVDKVGYKKSMVFGLLVMACGAAGFLPAAHLAVFPVFLMALVVLAAGMTLVQVAMNPYVAIIGPPATASSRLNLSQAFNSLGTFIAPWVGGALILRGAAAALPQAQIHSMTEAARQAYRIGQASTVNVPYITFTIALVVLAMALAAIKLKTTTTGVSEHTQDFRPGAFAEALLKPDSIWRHPWLLFAAGGIFVYVGAEVTIGTLLVLYMGLPQIAGLREAVAANFLMCYWGGAMVGRFIGSAVLQKVKTGIVLCAAAICAFILVVVSLKTTYVTGVSIWHIFGHNLIMPKSVPMWSMLAVGLCNSIMFPSIFTQGIQDLGPLTSKGSSLLIAAILGGSLIPLAQGALADKIGLHPSFIIPAICYIYIAAFGFACIRRPAAYDGIVPVEPV